MQSHSPVEIKPIEGEQLLHWVIAGGGPTGLLTAYLLSKLNVGKVILIEPREDYVRSGDYVQEVFKQISTLLDIPIEELIRSYANHIKDIERNMYEHVEKLKTVEIIRGKFTGFSKQQVHIEVNNNNTENEAKPQSDVSANDTHSIPCNVLFDCTGEHATVVTQLSAFKRSTIVESPHTRYVHANILLDKHVFEKYQSQLKWHNYWEELSHPFETVQRKETLEKLGWQYWENPYGYINKYGRTAFPFVLSDKMNQKKIKCHFYSEVPKTLEEKDILPWIEAHIANTAGMDSVSVELNHASKHHPQKQQCQFFEVIPRFTSPSYFLDEEENEILFIHLGDASLNNHFQFGIGIRRATDQLAKLKECISQDDNGKVQVDLKSYEEWSARNLKSYIDATKDFFKNRERELNKTIAQFRIISALHNEARDYLNSNDNSEYQLDRNFKALLMCWNWSNEDELKIENLNNSLVSMANRCKKLGDCQASGNREKARGYYDKALMIYSFFPTEYIEEIANIHLAKQNLTAESFENTTLIHPSSEVFKKKKNLYRLMEDSQPPLKKTNRDEPTDKNETPTLKRHN